MPLWNRKLKQKYHGGGGGAGCNHQKSSRRRGLGRQFQMRASYNLTSKNISEFGIRRATTEVFRIQTSRPKGPRARGGYKTRRFGSLCHFTAFARGCFDLLPPSLFPFFDSTSSRSRSGGNYLVDVRQEIWVVGICQVHAAQPTLRRNQVAVALHLASSSSSSSSSASSSPFFSPMFGFSERAAN
jgi:hypothetical protein